MITKIKSIEDIIEQAESCKSDADHVKYIV